uniref:Conantokin-Pr1 n=1 Tax=Conus parius TaxID=505247 RepID=CKP1_CONPI|nr:RecName: Full=Conantokin-Pr1; Short=Con-Pr1 [Conus parius]
GEDEYAEGIREYQLIHGKI